MPHNSEALGPTPSRSQPNCRSRRDLQLLYLRQSAGSYSFREKGEKRKMSQLRNEVWDLKKKKKKKKKNRPNVLYHSKQNKNKKKKKKKKK